MVENFLSATLDARLVADEVDLQVKKLAKKITYGSKIGQKNANKWAKKDEQNLQEEVDSIPINVLDTILAKYLGVQEEKIVREKDSTGKDLVTINVEPRHISDPDSADFKANSFDPEEFVKREAVTDEEKELFEELPFVEVNQGLCIKLEPP